MTISIDKKTLEDGSIEFTMKENKVIDTNKYIDFVRQTTSPASSNYTQLLGRMTELEASDNADVPRLLTAALGLTAESGEFTEIVKKIFLQGKPYNEENVFHMKRELGDIMWYWVNACRALGLDPNDVIEENVNKLKARYPGGEFDIHYSENRQAGDL